MSSIDHLEQLRLNFVEPGYGSLQVRLIMINFLALGISSVQIAAPLGAGALGGTFSERSGVVNIALEGLMLGGAFAFVAASWGIQQQFGDAAWVLWAAPLIGLLAALLTGLALAAIHALATVYFKADNIISGFAINIFALGATNFLLKRIFNSSSNSERCLSFGTWDVFPQGHSLSAMNQLMHPLLFLLLFIFIFSHWLFYRTRFGLRLRSVGENPQAADSLGVNVAFYRMMGVLISGVIASIGGVWLASDQGLFISNMTAGRGFIALAAMIIGKWRPWGAAVACLVFGLAQALQTQLQIFQQGVPTQLIQAFPYLLTLVVIAGLVGRSTPPAAVGIPYEKERT